MELNERARAQQPMMKRKGSLHRGRRDAETRYAMQSLTQVRYGTTHDLVCRDLLHWREMDGAARPATSKRFGERGARRPDAGFRGF